MDDSELMRHYRLDCAGMMFVNEISHTAQKCHSVRN